MSSKPSAPGRFFRTGPADALPAACGVGIVALILGTFVWFDHMSWWLVVPAFAAVTFSYFWNLQAISHNFIHNPFFRSPLLNRLYSVLETVAIGIPHVCYHHYHMNHHFGDNDAKGPDGSTKDWSSIYRHSRDENPESFWTYCLVSYWRVETVPLLKTVAKHGPAEVGWMVVEGAVLAGVWAAMAWFNWQYFVFFYLPSYYLGWMLSYAEGYLEHYGAQPGNYFANSVSSYNRLYNVVFFNNGYHQEHHWDPKTHWTRMHRLHEEIKPQLDANRTRVLYGPHITGFIEDWWFGRANVLREPVRQAEAADAEPPQEMTRMAA